MPSTYEYSTQSYRLSCSRCDASVLATSTWLGDAVDSDGTPVSATFRWIAGSRQSWHSLCRNCERAANRARRTTASRVPRTTTAPLGIARKFGVEFECGVPREIGSFEIQTALAEAGVGDWHVKTDCSIHVSGMSGFEIVSPPLSGEEGEQAVRTAARVLNSLGATVNRTCGTHVHHDANDLSVEQIKRVARGWFNNQHLINGLVAPSRRDGNGTIYCTPLTDTEVRHIESKPDLRSMRSLGISRYKTLNLDSYGRRGTIEIRQHQGTLDAEKVISWMRLGQAIIDTAKVETAPLATASRMRDLLTTLGDRLNETARTFLLGRAVEFNVVAV